MKLLRGRKTLSDKVNYPNEQRNSKPSCCNILIFTLPRVYAFRQLNQVVLTVERLQDCLFCSRHMHVYKTLMN